MFRILYIDDEPGLLEIGKMFLEQGGQFIVDTITSAREALSLLNTTDYDAIISDYQMPEMDGIEFLKRIRASKKTIPFILFTGRGREEIVIQALNEGADFYLQKGGEPKSQFAELSNKIHYAVMRRRAEESLKQNEAQLRQIIDLVPHLIFAKDKNGNFLLANKAVARLYNTDVENIIGHSQASLDENSGRLKRMLDEDREVIATGTTKYVGEDFYTGPDGNTCVFQTTKVPFTTVGNNQQAVLGIGIDITKRKEAEEALRESEERYRRIVETTDEGIFQLDANNKITYVNRKMAEMHCCMPEEMLEKDINLFLVAEDLPENSIRTEERRTGKSGRYERRYVTKDKKIRWMQISATPLMDPDGTYRGSFAMCSDITDRKTTENEIIRKNEDLHAAYEQLTAGEEELRRNYNELAKSRSLLQESEQRYRNVVEDQTEFISRFLPDGKHIFVNEAYCRYFNKSRDDIVGHRFQPEIPVEDQKRVKQFFSSLTPDHPIDRIEHRIIMPDGTLRWQWWSDRAIFDASGNVIEYQSVGRDVTEEKETEIAWKESEIRFREQYENNPLAIFTYQYRDNDFVFIDCNKAALALTDGRANTYLGTSVTGLYEDRPKIVSGIRRCYNDRTVISAEVVSEHFLPGRLIHTTAAFVPPDLVMVHMDDITDKKLAEEALRQNQRKLADAMDLADLVTWECDIRTGILTFDNRFSSLYGTNMEQQGIRQMTAEEYLQRIVHPEDLHILLEEDEKTRMTTDPDYVSKREYRIIRSDGEVRYIEMCVGITKDTDGRTIKIHGVNQDISERKKAEGALSRANHQLSLLSGITRHDVRNKLTGVLGYLKLAEIKADDPALSGYFEKIESLVTEIQSQIEFNRIYQELGTRQAQWIELDAVMPRTRVPSHISLNADIRHVKVFADPMLEKIFSNLLDNSIRHGRHVTRIGVSVTMSASDLVVIWEDNGIGVAADEKGRIFESGFGKNTGLGLFLTKEILSLTGITIRETGTPGKGAKFEIAVPKGQYRVSSH